MRKPELRLFSLAQGHAAKQGANQDSHPGLCASLLHSCLIRLPLFCPNSRDCGSGRAELLGIRL